MPIPLCLFKLPDVHLSSFISSYWSLFEERNKSSESHISADSKLRGTNYSYFSLQRHSVNSFNCSQLQADEWHKDNEIAKTYFFSVFFPMKHRRSGCPKSTINSRSHLRQIERNTWFIPVSLGKLTSIRDLELRENCAKTIVGMFKWTSQSSRNVLIINNHAWPF